MARFAPVEITDEMRRSVFWRGVERANTYTFEAGGERLTLPALLFKDGSLTVDTNPARGLDKEQAAEIGRIIYGREEELGLPPPAPCDLSL